MFIKKPAVLALAICGAFAAQSAIAATLKEAVDRALQTNPDVRAQYYQFMASDSEVDVAKSTRGPQVNLKGYAGREWLKSPSADRLHYNHPGVALELNQLLFDGFATREEIRRADYSRQAQYYRLLDSADQVALEAVRAYLDVVRYQKLQAEARENWKVHKKTQVQIEQRVKAGVGRRVDLELAAGRLALAESNWLTETANLHDVTARYQRIIGELPDKSVTMPGPFPASEWDGAGLSRDRVAASPIFQAAVSEVMAARSSLASQKGSNYPTLNLIGRQEWDRNRTGVTGAHDNGVVQLQLNYNLYKGGGDSARKRLYSERLNAAMELRDKACRDTVQTNVIASNDRTRLQEQLKQLRQHELSTEKARDAYRQQFDIGQRTLLDLLDTENELFEARRARISAETDVMLADARTLAAQHRLLQALGLAPTSGPEDREAMDEDAGAVTCNLNPIEQASLDRSYDAPAEPNMEALQALKPMTGTGANASMRGVGGFMTLPADWEKKAKDFVEYWRVSWEKGDKDNYLKSYDTTFVPGNSMDTPNWEGFRKGRVDLSGGRTIVLKDLTVKALDNQTVEARFTQEYRSDRYSDVVEKTLIMKIRERDYGIMREMVTRGRLY